MNFKNVITYRLLAGAITPFLIGITVASCNDDKLAERLANDANPLANEDIRAAATSGIYSDNESSDNFGFDKCDPDSYTAARLEPFVRQELANLQRKSFDKGLEHCGYMYVDSSCNLQISDQITGTAHSCRIPQPDRTVAAYHTHGVNDGGTNAGNIPSGTDMRNTASTNIHNFVATPFGYLWYLDPDYQTATLLCRNCMPRDVSPDQVYSLIPIRRKLTLFEIEKIISKYSLTEGDR